MDIVVGYADTRIGNAALEVGIAEAKLRGARLHVLHTVRVGLRNEQPRVIARYKTRMAEIQERLEREGIEGRSEMLMVRKERGDALLAELQELSADMLIIGSRQRSPVGKLVLGSTVQHLLLRADCPVMVVRSWED
jgi:nucleotide-binding universal stress UspA family protein